jgi:protein-S-isoprenylcysteine O-methyltransferase
MSGPVWLHLNPPGLLFWVSYALFFIPEIFGTWRQKSQAADRRADRGSHRILAGGLVLGILLGFYAALRWQGLLLSPDQGAMLVAGSVLMLGGTALRWYAIQVLGRFFTRDVAIRSDHVIIEHGPYRWVRHPSYTGSLLTMLGIAVALDNVASLAMMMLIDLTVFAYRIMVEEAVLRAAFGAPYLAYQRRTARLIPFVF